LDIRGHVEEGDLAIAKALTRILGRDCVRFLEDCWGLVDWDTKDIHVVGGDDD